VFAAYQDRPKLSIDVMSGADAGAQVTYSGGLLRNVGSLAAFNEQGYNSSWNLHNQTARSWDDIGRKTADGVDSDFLSSQFRAVA
jgi:hypothetical protein